MYVSCVSVCLSVCVCVCVCALVMFSLPMIHSFDLVLFNNLFVTGECFFFEFF